MHHYVGWEDGYDINGLGPFVPSWKFPSRYYLLLHCSFLHVSYLTKLEFDLALGSLSIKQNCPNRIQFRKLYSNIFESTLPDPTSRDIYAHNMYTHTYV